MTPELYNALAGVIIFFVLLLIGAIVFLSLTED